MNLAPIIVTHVSPDWDAIGAPWLLQRYGGMTDACVVFVNTGNPDRDLLNSAAAVVDTGGAFDPWMSRFDHHQLPGAEANATCATVQVAQHLVVEGRADLTAIWPLVELIYAGDTGKPAANESRKLGMHALLSAAKASKRFDDAGLLKFGYDILDMLADQLTAQAIAAQTLREHIVYQSNDGFVVGLRNAPRAATFAAYDAGARFVIFADYTTNAIGIWRGGEGNTVHVGKLVDYAQQQATIRGNTPVAAELSTWFRHNAGFFAGRGTDKAPSPVPIGVDVADVARYLDEAWIR